MKAASCAKYDHKQALFVSCVSNDTKIRLFGISVECVLINPSPTANNIHVSDSTSKYYYILTVVLLLLVTVVCPKNVIVVGTATCS